MRVAALYDVHGNLPALEAVLGEVELAAPDAVLVGGDVLFGPMQSEALVRLRGLGDRAVFIRGNCEREVAARETSGDQLRDAWTHWCADQLGPEELAAVAAWPATAHLDVQGLGPVLFCHGSPRSDEEMITPATPDERIAAMLERVEERTIVCGHTHVQFDRAVSGHRIVNPGSVGMAYEGEPGLACWALLGPSIELCRTRYDAERAAAAMRATGIPHADEFVSMAVLEPASAAEATRAFEAAARTTQP